MKCRLISKLISILFFLALFSFSIAGAQKYKEIKIAGLKIYTEESLIQKTYLNKLAQGKNHFPLVSIRIVAFYQKAGYILAKAYLIQETGDRLIIFVDEGHIGRIVFRRLNSIDTLKMKYEFNLKDKIYNKYIVEKELSRLKKKYGFKDIRHTLVPASEGDKAFFQLDEEIIIPGLGKTRIPFFEEHSSRYNLEIDFTSQNRDTYRTLTYGIKTSYSKGLIPDAAYHYPAFMQKGDLLIIGSSIGIMYGLDRKFKEAPKWTFMEVHSEYYFAPWLKDYFTPMASISAYYSRASRPDIGLLSYEYLKLKSILAPGITLLKKLHIYAGLGGERVFIFSPEIDREADYIAEIEDHTDTWAIFESRVKLDIRPWTLKNTEKQEYEILFNYYKNKKSFYELNMRLEGDIEFSNLDFYIYAIEYAKIWNRPPFYHEYPVSNENFKGFMGKSYYTRNIIRFANEYKVSIYRDSYYLGFFTDAVSFEGSGYDLSGYQYGIVSGIAGHVIFLDQFEFNIFFGKDYLFSEKESQYNIYMNAHKKW